MKDKVAVITGTASGTGFGFAEQCAREGMKVVLAGITRILLTTPNLILKNIRCFYFIR